MVTWADYYSLIELLIEGLRRTRLLPVHDSNTLPVLQQMWTEPRPTQAYGSHPYVAHWGQWGGNPPRDPCTSGLQLLAHLPATRPSRPK